MKEVKLGSHIEIISGFAFKSNFFNDENNGLPLIRVRDVNSGFAGIYYNGPFDDKYVVNNGDFLIGMDGDFRCISWDHGKALLNQRVCKILPKSTINLAYLKHFIPKALNEIHRTTTFTTVKHLSSKKIEEIKIPLPSLENQKRIAKVLSDCETLITKRKNTITLLDELLQSTFLDMFGDPLVNPKNKPLKKLKEFYINQKEGTKCGPFGSALKKNEYKDIGIPVWNMDNISKNGDFIDHIKLYVSESKFKELKSYSTQNGDIIISRAGTVGKMCVISTNYSDSIISTNLIRLRLDSKKLLPIYFISLMHYCKGRIGRLKTGPDGAFTHMSTGILDNLKFPYSDINEQKKFAQIVKKVEVIKEVYKNHLQALENLYASLSQKAFTGKLDVSKVLLREIKYFSTDSNETPEDFKKQMDEFIIDIKTPITGLLQPTEEDKTPKFSKKEIDNLKIKPREKRDITDLSLADFYGIPLDIQASRENIDFDFTGDDLFYQFLLKDHFKDESFTSQDLFEKLHNKFYHRDLDFDNEKWKNIIFQFLKSKPPLLEQFFDKNDNTVKLKLTDEAYKA